MSQGLGPHTSRPHALWASAALLALAVGLALWHTPAQVGGAASGPVEVPAWATDTTTVRQPSPAPKALVGLDYHRCDICHGANRVSAQRPPGSATYQEFLVTHPRGRHVTCHDDQKPTRHEGVALDHGMNTNCFNCHHPTNREAFVDDFGREIPWDQPQLVCAKCHGLVFRDWQHGVHGRTNGYWDSAAGPRTRVKCTACHAPHHPPFPPMHPAPGPDTLRMGRQDYGPHTHEHNPLQLRLHSASEREGGAPENEEP